MRLNRWCLILLAIVVFTACDMGNGDKIKLANGNVAPQVANANASVVQLSADEQHGIAISEFHNHSTDPSLDWLNRGLADMLKTELGQSPYLNVFSLVQPQEFTAHPTTPEDSLAVLNRRLTTAREAQASILLNGWFANVDNQLSISVVIVEVLSGSIVRRVNVRGKGLEEIFSTVDELSAKIRENLRGDLNEVKENRLALAEMTHSVEAYRCYTEALKNRDKFLITEMEQCLHTALRHDSTFALAYLRLAQVKRSYGDIDSVKYYLEKVKTYDHKLSDVDRVWVGLLERFFKLDYESYITMLREAVQRYPGNIEFRYELGAFCHGTGNLNEALTQFEAILAQDPHHALSYNLLGYLFAKRGDFTTALQYIDQYQSFRPNEPNPYDSEGEILMLAGRLEEAEEKFRLVMERWPQFFNSPMRYAEIALERGNLEEALRASDKVINLLPNPKMRRHYDIYQALAYWRFGKYERAETILKNILNDSPADVRALMLTVELYENRGDSLTAKRLQTTAFRHLEALLLNEPLNIETVNNFVSFSMVNNSLDPHKLVKLLEYIEPKLQNSDLRSLTRFALGLNLLRAGSPENRAAADAIFEQHGDSFIDLLTMEHKNGWGSGWKYVAETMDYLITENPNHHPFIQRLLEIAHASNRSDLEILARLVRTRYYGLRGKTAALENEMQKMGFPPEASWEVAGPFFAGKESPFNFAFPPENAQSVRAVYAFNQREYRWRPADDGYADGYVNLRDQLHPTIWSVAYAWTYVYTPEQRQVQIRLGTDETCKLWLNDELIWKHYVKEAAVLDRDLVTVVLRPGYNKLLLKITNTDFDWGFYFRITDGDGKGFPDITFHNPSEVNQNLSTN